MWLNAEDENIQWLITELDNIKHDFLYMQMTEFTKAQLSAKIESTNRQLAFMKSPIRLILESDKNIIDIKVVEHEEDLFCKC